MGQYYGDLAKTQILQELFELPNERRDDSWKDTFLKNVGDASFASGSPQVILGPDGFSYFQLNTPEPYKEFQCFVISHMKDDFLLEQGFGVVINPAKGQPDWVFSYGDILDFHLTGTFYSSTVASDLPKHEVVGQEEQVLVGQPSEVMLPARTRSVIRTYLNSRGIMDGKMLLMSRTSTAGMREELVFNLTPEKFKSTEQYEDIMSRISWFLPRHYTYVAMRESSMDSFQPI